MARLLLDSQEQTLALGQALARVLPGCRPMPKVLLQGPLGAGKTCLARGLATGLPGGDAAEVASPSFNILNLYPTRPEIAHFDLYRLEGTGLDDELLDILDSEHILSIVEWPEHLSPEIMPDSWLHITLAMDERGRLAEIRATPDTRACLDTVLEQLDPGLRAPDPSEHV